MEGQLLEVCAPEMVPPFKPLIEKYLVQPVEELKIVMNDRGFVPFKPPKYQPYSFDLTKAASTSLIPLTSLKQLTYMKRW